MSTRGLFGLLINAASALNLRPRPISSPRLANAISSLGGPEVTIIGGGFGGLYTALRLCSLDWSGGPRPRVTLVDRSDRFSFSPMLYELATGTASSWEVAPRYEDLLAGTDVEFVRGEVSGIDEQEQLVRIVAADGAMLDRQLPFDLCVLALGIRPQTDAVPGVAENALTFQTAEDAIAVKRRLAELVRSTEKSDALRVAIVGGGYVGVELAANLARAREPADGLRVSLIHRADCLLPRAAEFSRNEAQRQLADAGVEVLLSTSVSQVGDGALTLVEQAGGSDMSDGRLRGGVEGRELEADLIVWTAGTQPSAVVSGLGLPTDSSGRISADAMLRVTGHPRLYALGDAAVVQVARGEPVPSTAQVAMQQADYAAWNIRAALRSQPGLAFRYTALGEMLSFGNDDASVAALGHLVKLNGRLASASRRVVYAARMPTPQQAAKVGLSWAIDAAFGAVRKAAGPP